MVILSQIIISWNPQWNFKGQEPKVEAQIKLKDEA